MKSNKVHEPYMKFKGWLRSNAITYSNIASLLNCNIGTVSQKINGYSDFKITEIAVMKEKYGIEYNLFLTESCEKETA